MEGGGNMVRVITYGTFDLFHEGHYKLLERAKQLGDYLIVGVTTEGYDEKRGKLNVVDSLLTRIENVKKTGFVDEVIVEEDLGQKLRDIKKYKIDIFTVGSDWTGKFDYLKDYCKVIYLERTKNVSSTMLRTKNKPFLGMGVIGTGRIAERFMPEARGVSGIDAKTVYNPNLESASRFANKFEIDYSKDLESFLSKIDAVYIASPHETHYKYIKTALEHGKHVLCEKPMVLNGAEAEELFNLAKEKELILLEAIKTAYCPGFNNLINIAFSGAIGNIRGIEACFTKLEKSTSRELNDTKYGGSFTELGSYTLLPIIKLFGLDYKKLQFETVNAENGLDIFSKAYFKYDAGIAEATCGLGVKSLGQLIISGTKGFISVDAPWWKTKNFELHYENSEDTERYSYKFAGDGLRYEISDFLSMINGNKHPGMKLNPKESIAIACIMERFLKENRNENMGT